MVTRILALVVFVLAVSPQLAAARPVLPQGNAEPTAVAAETVEPAVIDATVEPSDEPVFNMLGFRASIGALPLDGMRTTSVSLGLGVEHPVFRSTRVFGEYEWLWLFAVSERAMDTVAARPERHGNGHRASLGLRRELVGKGLGRTVRMFLDGELGAGMALVNDNMYGVQLLPNALVGLRFGYDVYSRSDDSPSRTFEAELLVRAIAVGDGIGMMFGVGLLWGN